MSASLPDSEDAPVMAFAQRLWERDHPVVEPVRFDRTSVLRRLEAGVAARKLSPMVDGRARLAELLYEFLAVGEWRAVDLSARLGWGETSTRRCLRTVCAAGLMARTPDAADGRIIRYALTRAGEDWVQTLVQAPQKGTEGPVKADSGRDLTSQ